MAKPPRVLDLGNSISAPVLRRIAEAADGLRGEDAWIVFSTQEEEPEDPRQKKKHFVSRAVASRADAEREAGKKAHRFAIGPLRTKKKTERVWEATHITVECRSNTGDTITKRILSERCDALFTTEAVIDKFVIPYYVQIHGWEYGADIVDAFNRPDTYALTHLPGSEYAARLVTDANDKSLLLPEPVPILPGDAAHAKADAGAAARGSATRAGADGGS